MEAYLKLIEDLLNTTSFLEEEYTYSGNEAYPPFLEGTARKSYYYLYALKLLGHDQKNGDVVIDLSRSLLESMMVVMYVQEFGKERKAKKFMLYSSIEVWSDGLYALDANIELPSDIVEKRRKEYELVKGDYLRPTKKEVAEKDALKALRVLEKVRVDITQEQKQQFIEYMTAGKSQEEIVNKSWSGVDLETIMNELEKKGKFPGNLHRSFEKIYTIGNRKNHLSPTDIDLILDSNERKKRNLGYNMNIGLYVSLLSYIKILIELAELRKDVKLKQKLDVTEEKLLVMAESDGQKPNNS